MFGVSVPGHSTLQQNASQGVNVADVERWPSAMAGGALLAIGLRRGYFKSPLGIGLLLVAGHILYRGITGVDHIYRLLGIDTSGRGAKGIKVEKSLTITKSPEELYRFWRDFENLPRFMGHLESVRVTGERRSHWRAKAPAGRTVEWDAEIVDDRPNELIAWRSLDGADVPNSGVVRFGPAPGGRGTEVKVELEYTPPGGAVGATIATLFGEEPTRQVAEDLRVLKQVLETGEVVRSDATLEGSGLPQRPAQPPAGAREHATATG